MAFAIMVDTFAALRERGKGETMSNPSDDLRRLADDERRAKAERAAQSASPSEERRAAIQARVEQAKSFIAGTVLPGMVQAKNEIEGTMDDRVGAVDHGDRGNTGGSVSLAIRKHSIARPECIIIMTATATDTGVDDQIQVAPSRGQGGRPQDRPHTSKAFPEGVDLSQITPGDVATLVVGNYAATIRMLRDAGIG